MWKSIGKPPFNEILDDLIKPIRTRIELREFYKASRQETAEPAATREEQEAQAKLQKLNEVQEQIINDAALAIYPVVDALMSKLPFCRLLEPIHHQDHHFLIIKLERNTDYYFEQDLMMVVLFQLSFKKQILGVYYSFVPFDDSGKTLDDILQNQIQWGFHYHVNLENSLKVGKPHEAIPEISYTKNWNTQNLTTHFEDWVEFVLRSHWEKYIKDFSSKWVSLP